MRDIALGEYKRRACEAWDASVVLSPHFVMMPHAYAFVMNWSIELHLKCLLLDMGFSDGDVKRVKHGTAELLKWCKGMDEEFAAICTKDAEQCINLLAILSTFNGGSRYPQPHQNGGVLRLDMHLQLKPLVDYIDDRMFEDRIVPR